MMQMKRELHSVCPWDLPPRWEAQLAEYSWTRQTIGCSGAAVFRLEAVGEPVLFVKTEPAGPFSEIPDETARLRWLATAGMPCPGVLAEATAKRRDWLLMSAIPGHNLASSPDLGPGLIVEIAADALRSLHTIDPARCPFDHSIDRRLAQIRARLDAGVIDEDDFDEERIGRTPQRVFQELLARRPHEEDLVVTHGDACLENLLAENDRFSGFVDCARLGVADRYQDLALATWSVQENLGEGWIEPFLRRYGAGIDPERSAFYAALNEFF